jgi:restriction system protein
MHEGSVMARRGESFFDTLLALPWWASVIVAAIAYVLLAFAAPAYFSGNQFTTGFGVAAKTYAPYAAGFFALIGLFSFIRSHFIKRRFDRLEGIEEVRQLPWRQFESIVAEAFRRRGYSVMENAVEGPDGGVDLVLRKDGDKVYVQCKQWKQSKVGVKPIRELYGVMAAGGAAGGYFVASGEYTNDARDFAQKCNIELIDGTTLVQLIAEAREPQPFIDPTHWRRDHTAIAATAQGPSCPTCGGAMVRRVAKRGANAGTEFWGCTSYPQCRGTRAM